MPAVSVLLSIFDQPNALAFSLLGYQRQSFRDFEVVVADDGSDEETGALLERFRAQSAFPIKRVWQENRGFRKAKIVNEAARASEGKILVFSDGDCIPSRDFVAVHARASGPGTFCAGGYVRLSAEYCRTLTPERVAAGEFESQLTAADRWRFRVTHWKSVWGVLWGKVTRPKAYGCNLSCGRDVFYGVNGYDENFDGFGKEDSDLRNRMRRYGAVARSVWSRAWVYHVDDVVDPKIRARRIPRRKNLEYYRRPDVPVRCVNGLEKLTAPRT